MGRLLQVQQASALTTDACIEWVGAKNTLGYGKLGVLGVDWLAHRLAYLLRYGSVPELLRHTCDNPGCINPRHLIPGSHQDNMDDMMQRGRQCRGESKATKLCQADVDSIRARFVAGTSRWAPGNGRELAAQYGVTVDFIRDIIGGRKWKTS